MAIYTTEMQDYLGNVLHPETDTQAVYHDDGETLDSKILKQVLITNQQILETNTIKKIIFPAITIDSAYYIDTFLSSTNVTVSHGIYNGTNGRIEIDQNAFIKSISFSYVL